MDYIFDFDGVIANSHSLMTSYLQSKFFISYNRSCKYVFKSTLKNSHSYFDLFKKFANNSFYRYTGNFLNSNNEVLIKSSVENIKKLNGRKILLTSNYSKVCDLILGNYITIFEDIIGFDKISSKTRGVRTIFSEKYKFTPNQTILITDTTGDIQEFQSISEIPNNNIFGVTWGFHSAPLILKYLKTENLINTPEQFLDIDKGKKLTNSIFLGNLL
jgi:phosphoglycolate phosphatase-like HAD superfamily hydrolase